MKTFFLTRDFASLNLILRDFTWFTCWQFFFLIVRSQQFLRALCSILSVSRWHLCAKNLRIVVKRASGAISVIKPTLHNFSCARCACWRSFPTGDFSHARLTWSTRIYVLEAFFPHVICVILCDLRDFAKLDSCATVRFYVISFGTAGWEKKTLPLWCCYDVPSLTPLPPSQTRTQLKFLNGQTNTNVHGYFELALVDVTNQREIQSNLTSLGATAFQTFKKATIRFVTWVSMSVNERRDTWSGTALDVQLQFLYANSLPLTGESWEWGQMVSLSAMDAKLLNWKSMKNASCKW